MNAVVEGRMRGTCKIACSDPSTGAFFLIVGVSESWRRSRSFDPGTMANGAEGEENVVEQCCVGRSGIFGYSVTRTWAFFVNVGSFKSLSETRAFEPKTMGSARAALKNAATQCSRSVDHQMASSAMYTRAFSVNLGALESQNQSRSCGRGTKGNARLVPENVAEQCVIGRKGRNGLCVMFCRAFGAV